MVNQLNHAVCPKVYKLLIKCPKEEAMSVLNDIFALNEVANRSQSEVVEVCISAGIFCQLMVCPCENRMNLHANKKKKDGYIWKCTRCKKERSVRSNSIVENCKLPLHLSLFIVKSFLSRLSPKKVCEFLNFKFDLRCVYRMYSNLQVYFQHACQLLLAPLGGFGEIVEIDEMIFRKRKYKRGRCRVTFWIVGIIKRSTNKVLMFPVLNRREDTMKHFINKLVNEGSIVYMIQMMRTTLHK